MSLRLPVRWQADTADLTKLDTVLAHLCCWCSHHAYYDTAKGMYRDLLGATDIYQIGPNDPNTLPVGYLFKLQECWIACFSCTPNLRWLARELLDTVYIKMPAPHLDAYVGSQWGRAALFAFDTFKNIFKQIVDGGGKLIFTGHSLGGAVAAVLWRLHCGFAGNLTHSSTCYSFGAPRVGNKKFQTYSADSFAIEIPEDIVTKLPPRAYFKQVFNLLGDEYTVRPTDPFYHHGTLCDLLNDGRMVEQPVSGSTNPHGAGLELQLIEGAAAQIPGFNTEVIGARSYFQLWEEGYFNHHSETYLDRLQKTLPQGTDDSNDLHHLAKFMTARDMPLPEEPPMLLTTWDPQIPNPPAPPETFAPRTRRIRH